MRLSARLSAAFLVFAACTATSHDRSSAPPPRPAALDIIFAHASSERAWVPFEAGSLVQHSGAFTHAMPSLVLSVADHARGATRIDAGQGAWASIVAEDLEVDALGSREGNTIVYEGASAHTDVVRVVAADRVEELRVLSDGASPIARWSIALGPAIDSVIVREGRVQLLDAGRSVRLLTTPIEALDVNGVHRAPTLEMSGSGSSRTLTATLDVHGLKAPIVLDPTWSAVAPMQYARMFHSATVLLDGRVLVTGGGQPPEIYEPTTNKWSVPAAPTTNLTGASIASLGGGTLLFVGGATPSAETIYMASTASWSIPAFALNNDYTPCHAEAVLSDKRVLFAGCQSSGAGASAEVLDPVAGTSIDAGTMAIGDTGEAFGYTTADLLPNGKVLVVGFGAQSGGASAQIFDPVALAWATTPMPTDRAYHVTARLLDGRILVAGGTPDPTITSSVSNAEVYDSSADSWTAAPPMTAPRSTAASANLGNFVLILGGDASSGGTTTDLYDVGANAWTAGPSMQNPRFGAAAAIVLGGEVLAIGGSVDSQGIIAATPGPGTPTTSVELLALPPIGSTCTSSDDCAFGLSCANGVCCSSSACAFGSACNNPGNLGRCTKNKGIACGGASECGSGFCVDGVCCENACNSSIGQCNVAGHLGTCLSVNGRTCASAVTCASGFCVDGVCCDSACGGCSACSAKVKGSGVDGTCAPVAAGADPHNSCATDPLFPVNCKTDGNCDGAGACRAFAPSGTPCGSTSCISGSVVGNVCNGSGLCNTATVACEPFTCSATSCKTGCKTAADCASDAYCSSADVCVVKEDAGAPCSSGTECSSGFCVDGVCCKAACTGQCEACAEPGTAGSCVPVTGAPRGSKRAQCPGDPTICGGQCNGSETAACQLAPANKKCGSTCGVGIVIKKACDGSGACLAEDPQNCVPFACDPTGTACEVTCTTNTDCAKGYTCEAAVCVPSSGATCSTDLSQSVTEDGQTTNCAPFLCDVTNGNCNQICATTDQCVAGATCDGNKKCIAPGGGTNSGGGCAFGSSSSSSSSSLTLGALVTLACSAFFVRRRRLNRCAR